MEPLNVLLSFLVETTCYLLFICCLLFICYLLFICLLFFVQYQLPFQLIDESTLPGWMIVLQTIIDRPIPQVII